MPNEILTEDQWDIVQAGGYHAFDYIVLCPNTTVFAARVNGAPSGVFASFAYDTVTTGAYTDVLEGQVILVSHTNDQRAAFFRGRVRKPPTSSILYINQDSPAIVDNDYVWVLDTYDVAEKKRNPPYVDFDIPPEGVAPIVKGMQSAYARLTTDSTAQFSFTPTMQPMTKSATAGTYAWTFPAGTVYDVGSSSSQSPTVTIPAGHHWARLVVTDSNDVSNWFAFQIIIGDPDTDPFFHLCHEPPDIEVGLETGYSASVSYWQGVENVLDRTRAVVITDEYYGTGDPEFNNVRFVGYMAKDNSTVRGDEKWGQLKDVSIDLQGFLPLAGQVTFDPILVRYVASPAAWDEMNIPTPQRVVTHILQRHSTLLNLCACDFGTVDDTYFSGDFPVSAASLMDAVQIASGKITAPLTQDAAGQLWFARNANFLPTDERDDLDSVTPTAIDLGQGQSFNIDHPHSKSIGSVTVDFVVYNTLTNTQYRLKGIAPASGKREGQEHSDVEEQLLSVETEVGASFTEAAQRTGDWYEYKNPVDMLTVDLDDGYGWLSPSANQWFTFDIPAADLPRGMAVAATDRWLLVRVSTQLSERGSRIVKATFRRESRGGAANIDVSIIPAETNTELPVVPLMPSYGGVFAPAASINYDSLSPDKKHPFSPFDLGQTGPMTAEQAAMETSYTTGPGVTSFAISFKIPDDVGAGFLSVNGEPYVVTASGSADLQAESDVVLDTSDPGFASGIMVTAGNEIGITATGTFGNPGGSIGPEGQGGTNPSTVAPTFSVLGLLGKIGSGGTWFFVGDSVTFTAASSGELYFAVNDIPGLYGDNNGDLDISVSGGDVNGVDAFYLYDFAEDGTPTNESLLGTGAGLFINGATAGTPPPFDPINHTYTFAWPGDGNEPEFHFEYSDYTKLQNVPLQITIEGPGAGT